MSRIPIPVMTTRECLAIAEETEAAREALYALLTRFPAAAFTDGNVEKEDNVRGILCHVTSAIFGYACWIARVLGRLDREVEKRERAEFLAEVRAVTDGPGFEAASRRASERSYAVMASLTADDLEREFESNWGRTYTIEAMLEHALVHLLRHRRQLEIHLGDRPRGITKAG